MAVGRASATAQPEGIEAMTEISGGYSVTVVVRLDEPWHFLSAPSPFAATELRVTIASAYDSHRVRVSGFAYRGDGSVGKIARVADWQSVNVLPDDLLQLVDAAYRETLHGMPKALVSTLGGVVRRRRDGG